MSRFASALTGAPVAVIGLAGRFPGASSVDELWRNILGSVESIRFFSREELLSSGVAEELLADPAYVPARGYLDDWDRFDAEFFGYSPSEAVAMDPQIRALHECVWEALEDSGYAPGNSLCPVGLFVGGSANPSWLAAAQERCGTPSERYHATVLNDGYAFSTRISYKLGFQGPSLTLQTACSSSLVALHIARLSLLAGECRIALAAGVSILFPPKTGYLHEPGTVSSPDGHCRSFDARAQGTLAGDGCGVVVLKRLDDALVDGDHLYAVVKSSAVNNDGRRKVGYTAPSVTGQEEVLRRARQTAGIEPETIGLVEAHGTATPLGDPIEIEALKRAFRTDKRRYCAIGSVKTNIGHLNDAAGIAGFIKATLALRDRVLPPSLHYSEPNPEIDFTKSPFYVNTAVRPWDGEAPRRACVSSFGVGGTNAHAILEEAPEPPARTSSEADTWKLLLLSARSEHALDALAEKLCRALGSDTAPDLDDAIYTLQVGRQAFSSRRAVLCRSRDDAIRNLVELPSDRVSTGTVCKGRATRAFLFPGQGAQYPGMGAGLLRALPEYRATVEECLEAAPPELVPELRAVLGLGGTPEEARANLAQTRLAQPALFICEVSCARLLQAFGLRPAVLLGHSLGELVAACLAGVFRLEDALDLVVRRGQRMQELPPGGMLSVALGAEDVSELLPTGVSLAAVDAPDRCTVSGPVPTIQELEKRLAALRVATRTLMVSHAFHSEMMDPVVEEFERAVEAVSRRPPEIPFLSNVTGGLITPEQATSPAYWGRQLRSTVRFGACLDTLLRTDGVLALEVGPGNALSTLARRLAVRRNSVSVIDMMRRRGDEGTDDEFLLRRLGGMWTRGVDVDWSVLHRGAGRRRVSLPTYPFAATRISAPDARERPGRRSPARLGRPERASESLFYVPVWRRAATLRLEAPKTDAGTRWVLFANDPAARTVADALREQGTEVLLVEPGARFETQDGEGVVRLAPSSLEDHGRLIEALEASPQLPTYVVHAWGLDLGGPTETPEAELEAALENVFYSVLFLVRSLAAWRRGPRIRLGIVTVNASEAPGGGRISPAQAVVAGLCPVIAQELTALHCRNVDVSAEDLSREGTSVVLRQVITELAAGDEDVVVAHRSGERWKLQVGSLGLPSLPADGLATRRGGVYLITGGLGEIGMLLAEHLVRTAQAKLVLITRPRPRRNGGPPPPSGREERGCAGRRERFLEQLRSSGAEVLTVSADCADREQMADAIRLAKRRFGALHGVIHAAASTHDTSISTPILSLDRAACEEQLAAKARGLLVLHELLHPSHVDFVLVMSSLASLLGGLGLGAYAAACSFQDACVRAWDATSPIRWIAVGWDGWSLPGSERKSFFGELRHLLTPRQGLDALARILTFSGPSRVLVSATDLSPRLQRWLAATDPPGAGSQGAVRALADGPVEEVLLGLWREFFGRPDVGSDDSFFELGGDSLMAVALASRINAALAIHLQVSDLLDARTVRGLVQRIETFRPSSPGEGIRPAPIRPSYPLSFAQEAFLSPRNLVYEIRFNCSGAFELTGTLDPESLEAAFRELFRRHEILRTSFDVVRRVQRVARHVDFELPVRRCTPAELRQRLESFVRPFDLSRPPLLRAELLETADGHSLLLLDMHHGITDGLSLKLMTSELWALCGGIRLPEVRLHYKDYAVWQRRGMDPDALRREERSWRRAFQGYTWTELPAAASGHDVPTHERIVLRIEPEVRRRWLAGCQAHRITLATLFVTALGVALRDRTGLEDVTLGLRVSRRNDAVLERMLGPFVEDAALRIRVPKRRGRDRILCEVRKAVAAVLDAPAYSYEALNDVLQQEQATPNGELFTIMINSLPEIAPPSSDSSLQGTFRTLPRPLASKYHMNVRLREGRQLLVDVKYRKDKYPEEEVRDFFDEAFLAACNLAKQAS